MTSYRNTTSAREDVKVNVKLKLAAAWTSLMFFVIYIDYFHLYQPGEIDVIRGGDIHVFDISPTLLTMMLASVAIPALMVMLSMTLPARVNRATNLVVALLYIPFSMFNAVGESWTYFYGLSIGIEVLLLAFILRSAWTWPRTPAVPAGPATTDLRQDLQQ